MDFAKFRPRGGTKAQWETANPVLGKREMGIQWESEIGVGKVVIKFGNGVTAWNNLDTAVEVENDLVNKIISSIVTVSDEYPILNDGDSLSTLVGKIKKYIQDLKDKKLDKSARYDGTDSTSTELVPTANALRGVNAKADKNASDITTLSNNLSNFTVMRNASGVNQFKAVDQNGNNGMLFKVKDNSEFSVNVWKDNAFGNEKILATKDDLNTVLMYRGVITGDLNRGRNLAIAPGIYSIQSVSTVTNGPSDFIGWGIFVQFPDNLFSQMILNSPNYIKFRKYSGSNPSWSAW